MADGLRRQQQRDVAQQLGSDLSVMRDAVSQNRRNICAHRIAEALEDVTGPGQLVGWAAVAVRRRSDGSTETFVCGDPSSSDLEIKGYLHSAVWEAAHNPEGLAL